MTRETPRTRAEACATAEREPKSRQDAGATKAGEKQGRLGDSPRARCIVPLQEEEVAYAEEFVGLGGGYARVGGQAVEVVETGAGRP